MKFQKKYIYIFLLFFLSIFICTLLWNSIKFEPNRYDIIGHYSLNNFNPLNEIVRYIFFISLPFIVFLVSKIYFFKISSQDVLESFKIKYENILVEKSLYYLLFLLISYLIFELFSQNFPIHKIDIYHEGQRLSSAYKSFLDNSLWTGSFVTVGIIYETIGTKLIWGLFNKQTIGLMRVLDLFYIFLTKISLVYLFFEISKYTKLDLKFKLLFFLFVTFMGLSLVSYNLNSPGNIHFREVPILITLIIIIKSLNKSSLLLNLIFGFLSVFIFLWSLDRGIVFSLLLFLFCIFLIFNNRYKDFLNLIICISFFWFLFYFFETEEFKAFWINTYDVITELNYIHGIIHPTPFSDEQNSSRATKSLIVILFSVVFSTNFLLNRDNKNLNIFKFILFFLSIIGFLSYIYALGRSDGPHIKQTFGFPTIFLITIITYFVLKITSDLNIKIIKKFSYLNFIPFIIVISIGLIFFDYKNIFNYKERFLNYVDLSDDKFLSQEDNIFIKKASNIIKNEECIQLFTNDAALLYLVKKPSCTKFYFFWSVGSEKNQQILIKNSKKIKYAISGGVTDKWSQPIEIKNPVLYDYIDKNFQIINKIGNRNILLKKD